MLGAEEHNLGRQLGTVMVGVVAPTLAQRARNASSNLIIYLGIASLLGLLGSWLLARRIKRQTLGLEPREIAGLAEHREAMLYGIAEGVIALDPHHRVTLVNAVGRTLLDLPEGMPADVMTHLKTVWCAGQQLRITRDGEPPDTAGKTPGKKPFGGKKSFGPKKDFGERKPFGPKKSFGPKKPHRKGPRPD